MSQETLDHAKQKVSENNSNINYSISNQMKVIKRDGKTEDIAFDKIARRIKFLVDAEPALTIDIGKLTQTVISSLVNLITTSEIDKISANVCSDMAMYGNLDYEILATRIELSNLYKNTHDKFSDFMFSMIDDPKSLIADWVGPMIMKYRDTLDQMIDNSRDSQFSYLGVMTMMKSYLLVDSKKRITERPQYMWLRTALELWRDNMTMVHTCYDYMSQFYLTQATPTLFNSCLKKNQLSSCMLLTNYEDSISGIYETVTKSAILGAESAGIGIDVTNIRARGSLISSTNRPSRGVLPFMHLYNATSEEIIDQGGKRPMSIAVYMQPWHSDFCEFIELRSNDNNGQFRFRELFYAVWNNNLLNARVRAGAKWSFFCPTRAPKLLTTYGKEFEKVYEEYENAGLANSEVPAKQVYDLIAKLMIETGQPYHLNKDACNFKSNLKNVAMINCSNLCTEILIPSGIVDDTRHIGVCTLASINLKKLTKPCVLNSDGQIDVPGYFDYDRLREVTRMAVRNLNRCIEVQRYTLDDCRRSSERFRPIGVGIQGLAEVFMDLGIEFESQEARVINQHIAEEIYYSAILESMTWADQYGSYSGFIGSPASQGKLQPHLWQEYNQINGIEWPMEYKYDWDSIARHVQKRGLYNSLLVAYMPTASTSRIFNTISGFDPNIANIYTKKTLASEFIIINRHLVETLKKINLWSPEMQNKIIMADGSIKGITEIPARIRGIYKTAYEMSMKNIMNMAADRGHFICQSQSLNLYFGEINKNKIMSAITYGMEIGLKTIAYYTRSRAATEAVKVTLMNQVAQNSDSGQNDTSPKKSCSRENRDCESCMA